MLITDVIVFDLVRRAKYSANSAIKPASSRERTKPVTSCQLDTSELVELLQKSAVEHLKIFRQLDKIVTTEFEALMYTYNPRRVSAMFTVVYTERAYADW